MIQGKLHSTLDPIEVAVLQLWRNYAAEALWTDIPTRKAMQKLSGRLDQAITDQLPELKDRFCLNVAYGNFGE